MMPVTQWIEDLILVTYEVVVHGGYVWIMYGYYNEK